MLGWTLMTIFRALVLTPASGRGAWVTTGASGRGGWPASAARSPGSSRTRRWSFTGMTRVKSLYLNIFSAGSGSGPWTRRPGCLSSSVGTWKGGRSKKWGVKKFEIEQLHKLERLSVNVWMLWSKGSLSGTRLRTWSGQWETSKRSKNSRASFPVSKPHFNIPRPTLLWRKIRFKHLLLLLYFVSHSFYLSIKFILLVNIKSFMESHYRLAMVCPPPMTVSGPGPALLWTNNSASLLEDAQGGSHSWEVLSRTIKLDILLTWELEYFLEMNIWDFVTFWGLLFDIELVKLTGGDNSHLNILFLGNPSAIQPQVNLI